MISLTQSALHSGSRVASAYAEARAAAAPSPGTAPEGHGLTAAARDFAAVMERADSASIGAMQGQGDTHALVQSIAEAQIALETAVAVRDRVVEAYQEILRMPV